jgi:predicted transposase/invertase (TIGR01784 family)
MSRSQNEAQSFDKIIRENLEEVLLPLAGKLFGIHIKTSRSLPEKLLTTIEREPDFAKIVETEEGEVFILHLEFQTQDEAGMAFRMAEYKAILQRKFNLAVRQFVIFLGRGRSKMESVLPEAFIIKDFGLIHIEAFSYLRLIRSEIPEEIILAILANFGEEKAEVVVKQIAKRLQQYSRDPVSLQKYLRQLTILSRLRNLDELTIKTESEMPIIYDSTNDYLYLKGKKEGVEEGIEKGMEKGLEKGMLEGKKVVIRKLLLSGKLSVSEIAELADVGEVFVEKVKVEMEAGDGLSPK